MSRGKKVNARSIQTPDKERMAELKFDPTDADSIDEKIWITRNRLSSLNGAMNGLLAKRYPKAIAGMLSWGIYSQQLTAQTEDNCLINKETVKDVQFIKEVVERLPNFVSAVERYDEDFGVYYVCALAKDDTAIDGLHSADKLTAWLSTLASFGITGLNLKLQRQLNEVNQDPALKAWMDSFAA